MHRQKINDVNIEIGRKIFELRTSVNKTQAEVAENIGVSPQHISNYENGKCGIKYSRVVQIEAFLQKSISRGLSEDQTSYVAPDYEMKDVQADIESLLAKIKKRSRR